MSISLPSLCESEPTLIQHFDVNVSGTDFVVGDIHNQFTQLKKQLESLNFDKNNDRLFCVGDLIDRGSQADDNGYAVLDYLTQKWFYSIRGNHEDLILSLLSLPENATQPCFDLAQKNGADWLFDGDPKLLSTLNQYCLNESSNVTNKLTFEQLLNSFPSAKSLYQAFYQLPYIIQIGDNIGIIHAEVPLYIRQWSELINEVKSHSMDTLESLLWGRKRISYDINDRISGIDVIFCGHSITQEADNYGNHRNIDTGAYARKGSTLHIEKINPDFDYGIDPSAGATSLSSDDIVSYHQKDNVSYVRLSELSPENKMLYLLFHQGKTSPDIEGEKNIFYAQDYDYFLSLKNQYLNQYHSLDEFIEELSAFQAPF